ncbi:NACHT domain-containing protein [Actinacidiphila glaucinigra]|uniref:NACHT domain-containing protein n=1 Tax=Actinacidiphila glaucinigra TaxID=235986 RepID=UPI0034045C70
MIAETAALRLGTTVANAAGRWWLGGKQREQERHLSMEELVRVRVSGVRFQREVRQQFEQITNAVFDRLEPFLRHEFQRLDEGGHLAVINAVSDTFTQANLSDDALLSANANPAELIRNITDSVRGPIGLSEAELRLYEVLFAECVEYYVRIVRSLPVFEERAAGELLARTATLGVAVARILERLPDRSLFAPDGTDQDTAFRRTYLELVSRDLDEVELFRRAADQATAPRVRLSIAYVSLRATGDDGKRRRTVRSLPLLRPNMSHWDETEVQNSGMGVEAALRAAPRVLLRGEAGSGKTTLLRWLAITAARGAFSGELADWNGLTPILIKLREYSSRTPPSPEAMLDGIAAHITGFMPRGWVERQLDSGQVLLLIDGVDELLDRERRVVRDWLRKLLGQYRGVRVVVTSRPTAARADWLRRENFTAFHLDRMTPADLAVFVRQWHQAVRELGGELPCPVDQLPQYEQSLLNSLKDRAHLQSLAGTPLLAAMLCAMHLNRGRQLPRDRMELYRNALHTLVHDRDADRNVPSAVVSKLSLGDKLVILRDLAWRLSDNNHSEIDLERAAGYVGAKLKAMRHLDVLDGEKVLAQLRDRSGILRSPAEDRVDFVHRTFQEYLAAKEAVEEDRIGNLVGRAHLDLWRETIIMTAGHANTRQREELLGGILDRAEQEPRYARTLRLLAAACQETLPSVSERLAARLDKAVTKLLPARRKTDPPALAAVGPSLLRWLPKSLGQLTEKAAAETVRTVALIGGEESLELLKGYVDDERPGVVGALVGAWDYFDADAYAKDVLSRLSLAGSSVVFTHSAQLQAASLLGPVRGAHVRVPVRGLDFLAKFQTLRELWVSALREGVDLSILRAHPEVREVLIFPDGPVAISGESVLSELTQLRWLSIPLPESLDLSSLRSLSRLQFLGLHELIGEVDLESLNALPNLRDLQLEGLERWTASGFENLASMTSLNSLFMVNCDANAWLANMESPPPSLSNLYLHSCTVPSNARAFTQLKNLKLMTFSDCQTSDGKPIPEISIPGVQFLSL